ncbi:MAG: response regulator [Chloroflexota bacterium]
MAEKILIIDDDLETLHLVGLLLERKGYDISVAESGQIALEKIEKEIPDLIILDIMMPGMSGIDVARHLRAQESTNLTPIIMFTAKSQIDDRVEGLEAGADAYLAKPSEPKELYAQVKVLLARAKSSQTPIPEPITQQEQPPGFMIGVLSAKGGLGVSSLATNLGIALHKNTEKSVLVTDFRPGSSDIGLELGYSNPINLSTLLQMPANAISSKDIIEQMITHHSGIHLLLSPRRAKDAVHTGMIDSFTAIAEQMPFATDYVILDLGPTLPPLTQAVIQFCDEVIIVIEPTTTGAEQAKILMEDLIELGVSEGRMRPVLINRLRSSIQLGWSDVQEILGRKLTAIFTPAPDLAYMANDQSNPMILLQPNSITAEQFKNLASEIAN